MKAFSTVTGLVAPLDRANVDTDQIIPKQYLKSIHRTGFGDNLFDGWRFLDEGAPGMTPNERRINHDFVLNLPRYQGARVLLARDNFGCGSSREHAVWALMEFGFDVVIAPSFADIFYNNCFKNGLLPIVLEKEIIDDLFRRATSEDGLELTVDLVAQRITAPEGMLIGFEFDPVRKEKLVKGLDDIGMTLAERARIEAFEAKHYARMPLAARGPGETIMSAKVLVLPGDGIGVEVMASAVSVMQKVASDAGLPLAFTDGLVGGLAIDRHGTPLPDDTLVAAKASDVVLLGGVGGPKWDNLPTAQRPERGLLRLRSELALFANLRPAILFGPLAAASSLKPELVADLDILILRELTGGIYFGEPRGIREENGERVGFNTLVYAEHEIERIARVAFDLARKRNGRVCSVDKANVLEVTALWREVVTRVHQAEFQDIELSHMFVDNAGMQLVRAPKQFDVIVTTNMFGDILSDVAAMLTGSLGMLPSASLAASGKGLYEPVHGTAPDIAGRNIANPLATILSVAMAFRYTLNAGGCADRIEQAVARVLADGIRTADIAAAGEATVGTREMGEAVLAAL